MGVVIAILTVAVALAKSGVVQRFRNLLPVMNRIAGGLLIVAGAYVAYYGWYEIRVLNGATGDPIVDRAIELQTWLQNTVVPDDPVAFTIGAGIVLATLTAGIAIARRIMRAGREPDTHHDLLLEGADGGPRVGNDDAALVDGGTTRR
jgi:hypothetical protein